MEITTLIENTTRDKRLGAEPGLSMYIQALGRNILFDMGASDRFIQNADALETDLRAVDMAVISHAHYDHGGGLEPFLALNTAAPVYLSREGLGDYYADIGSRLPIVIYPAVNLLCKSSRLFSRYIGLNKSVLKRHADRMHFLQDNTRINDHVHLLTPIDGQYPPPGGNKFLLTRRGGRMLPDSFRHEVILVIQEPDGLVIFTGCGHTGVLNIIAAARRAFPDQAIKGVVGGFHLALQPGKPRIAGTRKDILMIAETLLDLNVGKIYTGHCTGDMGFDILKERLGQRIHRLRSGVGINL